MAKLPSFQFYPGDWMKDPALRACSAAARGLWMDVLCLMFESDRRGFLQAPSGKPYSHEQLARMTGCLPDEVSRLLAELESSGVFSRTKNGTIFSRRLKRDEENRADHRKRQNDYRNSLKSNENGDASVTSDVTGVSHPSSSSSSTSLHNNKELTLLSPSAPGPSTRPEEFANAWNRDRGSLPKVAEFSDSRRKKVVSRIRQGVTLERFTEAILCCTRKPFLRGDNEGGWIATFDWLIENDKNIDKAIANPYGLTGNRKSNPLDLVEFANGVKQ